MSGGNAATAGTFGTIQVNADGSYVYTLTKPFDTSPDANNGANTEVAESFNYRVTDANGNTATGTITVNIVDDVPTVIFPEAAALPNEVGGTFVGDLDTNSDVNNNAGADGLGSVRFPTTLNGAPSNLTSGGLPIIYYVTADGHTLTGAVGPNAATGPIFTIVLTDGATDTYAITMIGTVDGGATNVNFDLTAGYDFEGGNSSWLAFFKAGNDNSHDLLMTPAINGLPAQSINSTANFGGVNNAFVGTTQGLVETFRIDFVTDVQDGGGVDDTAVVGPGNNYGLPETEITHSTATIWQTVRLRPSGSRAVEKRRLISGQLTTMTSPSWAMQSSWWATVRSTTSRQSSSETMAPSKLSQQTVPIPWGDEPSLSTSTRQGVIPSALMATTPSTSPA